MKVVMDSPTLKVIDDLLPEDTFKAVTQTVEKLEYRATRPNTEAWRGVQDENPLEGVVPMIWLSAVLQIPPEARATAQRQMKMKLYPTESVLDRAFEAIKHEVTAVEHLFGREGRDWVGFTSRAYAYGRGNRADWHGDGSMYTGAFTYYVHDHWSPSWGGDLLVQSPFDEQTREQIDQGYFVSPLPNRLVLLKGGTPHSVSRLSAEIGDRYRRTIAGFFATPSHAASMMASVLADAGAAK